ncbi:MAG: AAA family ATPase [Actinomycetia bacterium]|nr:AAA family ATPase [Actinomycetes bacterium]
MLITDLTIGGLRAYRPDPTTVDLAPLTLVFGPNSAGKSSLLAVMPMLQQTAARPDVLNMSGDLVEGGTFRMAIHRHDESLPMTLGFGWRAPDGSRHAGSGVFRWDAQHRSGRRERMYVDNGELQSHVDGPRPWGGQEGAAVARQLAPEFYETLSRVFFLGPMRARAERTTRVGQGWDDYVGPAGEHMAELLYDRPDLVAEVNDWCDRMGLGYRVRMLSPRSHDIVVSAGDFAVLALEDVRHDPPVLVSSRAVGYGVGQLLPVITQSLIAEHAMVIVEQPEVHLHPRLQAATGDLFIESVQQKQNQVLVETHSEHLVLRILRRVREGTFDPADLAILYVDLHEDGAAFVRNLEVDAGGEIVDGWPGNFFDDRLGEVLPGLANR